jgi:hypothetical protein
MNAYAEHYTFNGYTYRTHKHLINGEYRKKGVSSNNAYKFVVDTDKSFVTIQIGNEEINRFTIIRVTVSEDPAAGIYIYCNEGTTLNLYTDKFNKRHIIQHNSKMIRVFDI